ncbi:MAG: biotin/lipoyl-binding protein [Propionibacteriaceae bacterium]|jgi:methylmalonyl-CoA carboxyltransferase small subunit|nr:biotin/lipoyl-binding protein [Propionibacteriaceae bacterium]
MKLKVTVNDVPYEVEVEIEDTYPQLPIINMAQVGLPPVPEKPQAAKKGYEIVAPLAGSVRKVYATVDQEVEAGDVVAILEAMKMETEITAPVDGKIAKILVENGAAVQGGDVLIEMA